MQPEQTICLFRLHLFIRLYGRNWLYISVYQKRRAGLYNRYNIAWHCIRRVCQQVYQLRPYGRCTPQHNGFIAAKLSRYSWYLQLIAV